MMSKLYNNSEPQFPHVFVGIIWPLPGVAPIIETSRREELGFWFVCFPQYVLNILGIAWHMVTLVNAYGMNDSSANSEDPEDGRGCSLSVSDKQQQQLFQRAETNPVKGLCSRKAARIDRG